MRETWRVSSLSGLRIVFIARSLSLTADFYSVSLHKSAYDILCAPARKIVRNFSRPGGTRGEERNTRNFLICIPGPRLPVSLSAFSRPCRARESSRFALVQFFFFFADAFLFSPRKSHAYGTAIKALRSRNSRKEIDARASARSTIMLKKLAVFCAQLILIQYNFRCRVLEANA